ncbi:hypothetical protein GCM10023317_00210 [Actinopolymorpha pittospori]|uniref:Uncharacterized protein n=1 Tax=Actinopolymorpha pittospori TaxID=648752 RepID=A0A927MX43_9ACTN|nr:hypothetical protein [Actinopolymorpha pittospori]
MGFEPMWQGGPCQAVFKKDAHPHTTCTFADRSTERRPSAPLKAIQPVLRPGGLFFLGPYGGESSEGRPLMAGTIRHSSSPGHRCEIQKFVGRFFEMEDFHVVTADASRFQSLPLRRPTS